MDEAVLVHEMSGAAGMVVQVAPSDDDQPATLPACAYRVKLESPDDSPELVLDVPVCSDHCP